LVHIVRACRVEPVEVGVELMLSRVDVDGLLYGVTGPTGVLTSQGFTIDLIEDERYSVDLIATWSPDDKVTLAHRL